MGSPKRDKLLECARKLFESEGLHTTGIDKILETAGVAKMTLYNNFGSKDNLIVAVLDQSSNNMIDRLRTHAAGFSNDPYEQILGVFDLFSSWFDSKEFCGCMFQAAVAEFPDPSSPPSIAARAHHQRITDLFVELGTKAELSDAQTLGKMLSMLASGSMCTARQAKNKEPALLAREIAEILLERACTKTSNLQAKQICSPTTK